LDSLQGLLVAAPSVVPLHVSETSECFEKAKQQGLAPDGDGALLWVHDNHTLVLDMFRHGKERRETSLFRKPPEESA
jgi:hypothetical protein